MCLELVLVNCSIVHLVHAKVVVGHSIHANAFFLGNHLLRMLFGREFTIRLLAEELIVLVRGGPVVYLRNEAHAEVGYTICQWVTNLHLFFLGKLFRGVGVASRCRALHLRRSVALREGKVRVSGLLDHYGGGLLGLRYRLRVQLV